MINGWLLYGKGGKFIYLLFFAFKNRECLLAMSLIYKFVAYVTGFLLQPLRQHWSIKACLLKKAQINTTSFADLIIRCDQHITTYYNWLGMFFIKINL